MPNRRHIGMAASIVSSAIIGTVLPILAAHADAATLYVNNDPAAHCSDSGPGTQAQPFCTVQAAANAAQPGQTVAIAQGDYPEQVTVKNSGTTGNAIVFKGTFANGSPAVQVGEDWYGPNATSLPHGFVLSGGVHDVTISDIAFDTPQEAVLVSGADHIVLDGNTLTEVGRQNTRAPAYPKPAAGIRLTGNTTNTTVSRNQIGASGDAGIAVDPGVSGTVITTNAVTANRGSGIVVADAPGTVVTSNSVVQNCNIGVTLDGNSTSSVVENNIIYSDNGCAPSGGTELAVSAGATSGTKVDYNVVQPGNGGTAYNWAGKTYGSASAFNIDTTQGTHDLTTDPHIVLYSSTWVTPQAESGATDSADANAPGELSTDLYGNPRVRDPLAPAATTQPGYYDRGAIELQDPMSASLTPSLSTAPYHPLDVVINGKISSPWAPATGTLDFGDGSAAKTGVTSADLPLTHTYPESGTYTITLTATDQTGKTVTATASITVPPLNPIVASVVWSQPDPATPRGTLIDGSSGPWPIAKITIDPGDGTPAFVSNGNTHPSFAHEYAHAGTYNVTETVVDDHGRSVTKTMPQQVTVAPMGAPAANASRTIEMVVNGSLHEIYPDSWGYWHGSPALGTGSGITAMSFAHSPSGARVIEAVENGELHEIYADAGSTDWHDNALDAVTGNVTAVGFAYSPSGARVIEAVEDGKLHEIYSAPDGWHDNVVDGVSGNITTLGFAYSPSGARVIEAAENGAVHEIYSAADGWHDGVAFRDSVVGSLSFAYSPNGARVIEVADTAGYLSEVYSAADGWHGGTVLGGVRVSALSAKVRHDGVRVMEVIENGTLHEIYSDTDGWHDNSINIGGGSVVSFDLG